MSKKRKNNSQKINLRKNTIEEIMQKGQILSSFSIKIIAIITMTIDHIGAYLLEYLINGDNLLSFADNRSLYVILRFIGRLAFPLFCFLIVQGYLNSKNHKKYLLRLISFAIISEIPYDLASNNTLIEFTRQNIFFTLSLGLLALIFYNYLMIKKQSHILAILSVMATGITANLIGADYGFYGVLLIVMLYFAWNKKSYYLVIMIVTYVMYGHISIFVLLSIPIMLMYNETYGKYHHRLKYIFYIYYPIHLLSFYFIRHFLIQV